MEWKSIQINKQNIKRNIGTAVLIAMPHKSDYDGFSFWYTTKLIKVGKHSNALELVYNDEFIFKLKKVSKKNFNVLEEIEIDVEDFEEAFRVMNDNITSKKEDNESYLKIEQPIKIDKEIKILEELKNE